LRIEAYIKNRLTTVLEVFCEKEKAYLEKSKARPLILENLNLKLEYPEFSLTGQPDRVDELPEGLFILDYKTSGSLAHGQDMVDLGYRLQLPFYAVAMTQKTGKPILGVQFVELDKKGGRKNGIFFKKYNGKTSGCLTQVRSNSRSLMSESGSVAHSEKQPPEESPEQIVGETWEILEEHLRRDAGELAAGSFKARPRLLKRATECNLCRVSDLCGYRRLSSLESDEESAYG
jgi:ATP-dependent helicase/DNAse subunit B